MKTRNVLILLLGVIPFIMCSCNNQGNNTSKNNVQKELEIDVDIDTINQTIKFGNTLFSLPSPYQLTMMVKNAGTSFNENLINSVENNSKYVTTFKKCVNLGVYGADLAYMNLYEQSPLIVSHFSVIKSLATEQGLMSAFNDELVERIETNIDDKDSLLYIMSNTYRDVDIYLKDAQREKEGVMVLAGGWIEAMYILTQLAHTTKDANLICRVGESKQPLDNLIKILSPYYNEVKELETLIDALIGLVADFENVETSYTYNMPDIDAENKITSIKSTTKVVVPEPVLKQITDKVESIRTMLVE